MVTGYGAVSALGRSVPETWASVREGRGGIAIRTIGGGEYGPPSQDAPVAQIVDGYQAGLDAHFGPQTAAALDPFARMALAASLEALQMAGLVGASVLDEQTAVVVGHGLVGLETLEKGYERFYGMRSPRLHPATIPKVMISAAASAVAMAFQIHGPVFATSSACASSAHAIAQGAGLIASGQVRAAIVGGSEAVATPGSLRSWEAIHALSATTCRPFSADRDGMVLGEGGAVMIIEDFEHARARGATILGELIGVGMTSDAFHITQPALAGPVRAMRAAMTQAGALDAETVLISAHGTGTPLNDLTESQAIREVFGERAASHPVIATKSAHGHLLGGAAALQAIIGLVALHEGLAPPILNYTTPDPACAGIDLVLGESRAIDTKLLLQNAFAFGGLNVSLAFTTA